MDNRSTFEKVKAATVAIAWLREEQAGKPFSIVGSGFCIDPEGLVLTAGHVISAFMDKSMEAYIDEASAGGTDLRPKQMVIKHRALPFAIFFRTLPPHHLLAAPAQVDVVLARDDFDLALLRVGRHGFYLGGYPHVEIEKYENIREGDEVGTCGFPLGDFLQAKLGTATSSFTRGIVSSIIPAQGASVDTLKGFQLDLTVAPGNSGGPVFSLKTGRAFGVLKEAIKGSDGQLIRGLTVAEPVYPIIDDERLEIIKKTPHGQLPKFPEVPEVGD